MTRHLSSMPSGRSATVRVVDAIRPELDDAITNQLGNAVVR